MRAFPVVLLLSLVTTIHLGCDVAGELSCCEDVATGELTVQDGRSCPEGSTVTRTESFASSEENSDLEATICGGQVCCVEADGRRQLTPFGECDAPLSVDACEEEQTNCCLDFTGILIEVDRACGDDEFLIEPGGCSTVCCEADGLTGLISFDECTAERPNGAASGVALPASECDADPELDMGTPPPDMGAGGGQCTCNDAGVTFAIVSGCEGDAFADALEASFCRSAVEFDLEQDPDSFLLDDGATIGFADCQVRISCP